MKVGCACTPPAFAQRLGTDVDQMGIERARLGMGKDEVGVQGMASCERLGRSNH